MKIGTKSSKYSGYSFPEDGRSHTFTLRVPDSDIGVTKKAVDWGAPRWSVEARTNYRDERSKGLWKRGRGKWFYRQQTSIFVVPGCNCYVAPTPAPTAAPTAPTAPTAAAAPTAAR